MSRIITTIIVLLYFFPLRAQFDTHYSHVEQSKIAYTPGYTGFGEGICATILNRQQWINFEGAPATTFMAIHAPVRLFGMPSGVGLIITDDRLGMAQNFNLKANYAYHRPTANGKLGVGISTGMLNVTYNGSWIAPEGAEGDPAIPTPGENKMAFDLSVGAYFQGNDFNAALSITHINRPEINFYETEASYAARHYYLSGGYHFEIPSANIDIYPSFILESDISTIQFNINTTAVYNKKFWAGVTYRLGDAVALIGANLFEGLKLGFSYDISTNRIRKGSSEVMIQFCFDIDKDRKPRNYKSVRFL